jgi:hypothetical protein
MLEEENETLREKLEEARDLIDGALGIDTNDEDDDDLSPEDDVDLDEVQ